MTENVSPWSQVGHVLPDRRYCLGYRCLQPLGGAEGFGKAIVERFTSEGYTVVVVDINKVQGEAQAAKDGNLRYICGDVTLRETWEHVLAVTRTDYGRLDVVVNNAGQTLHRSFLDTRLSVLGIAYDPAVSETPTKWGSSLTPISLFILWTLPSMRESSMSMSR